MKSWPETSFPHCPFSCYNESAAFIYSLQCGFGGFNPKLLRGVSSCPLPESSVLHFDSWGLRRARERVRPEGKGFYGENLLDRTLFEYSIYSRSLRIFNGQWNTRFYG